MNIIKASLVAFVLVATFGVGYYAAVAQEGEGIFYYPDSLEVENIEYNEKEGLIKVAAKKGDGYHYLLIYRWKNPRPYATITLKPKPVEEVYTE